LRIALVGDRVRLEREAPAQEEKSAPSDRPLCACRDPVGREDFVALLLRTGLARIRRERRAFEERRPRAALEEQRMVRRRSGVERRPARVAQEERALERDVVGSLREDRQREQQKHKGTSHVARSLQQICLL
jgi:hypothetical protein